MLRSSSSFNKENDEDDDNYSNFDDTSLELTPGNIAHERQLQMERELRQQPQRENHQEFHHIQNSGTVDKTEKETQQQQQEEERNVTQQNFEQYNDNCRTKNVETNNINRVQQEKEDKVVAQQNNIKNLNRSPKITSTPISTTNLKQNQSTNKNLRTVSYNSIYESHNDDTDASFEFTPKNIADARIKEFEREAKISEGDTNIVRRQQQERESPFPPTTMTVTDSNTTTATQQQEERIEIEKINTISNEYPQYEESYDEEGNKKQLLHDTRRNGQSSDTAINNHIPGAFAVRGIDANDDDDDDDDDDIDSTYYLKSSEFRTSNLVMAENVDEEALVEKYNSRAKEMIRKKMEDEAIPATKLRLSIIERENEIHSMKRNCFLLSLVLVTIIVLILAIGIGLSKKRNDTMTMPPSSSSYIMNPYFSFLQDTYMNVSGDVVFNSSSDQYMALKWLTYDDDQNTTTTMDDIKHVDISSLNVRYALTVLYFSTNGLHWRYNTNYLIKNVSVCDWQFITCNSLGDVQVIRMDKNNLNGTIPPELGLITTAEIISFRDNHLHSIIPSTIGNISQLEHFDVDINKLSGSIPNSFTTLTNLERLHLSVNQLTGTIPIGLTDMKTLEAVSIHENYFTGSIPNFIQNKLKALDFMDNSFHGSIPDSIMKLQNLKVLTLSSNYLSGTIPSDINLPKTTILDLSYNYFMGTIPTTIGNCELLRDLYLTDNNLDGTIPTEFGLLTKLKLLNFDVNQLIGTIPTEIGLLDNLIEFAIDSNPITGTVPFSFSKLINIQWLGLTNTSLSGSLDDIFCSVNSNHNHLIWLEADCSRSTFQGEVQCSCCTYCCNDETKICESDYAQLCNSNIRSFKSFSNNGTICNCSNDHLRLSCSNVDCQTCNDDGTICGTSIEYGFSLLEDETDAGILTNKFIYQTGSKNGTTIIWQEDVFTGYGFCNITVNGEQCRTCSYSVCDDGFFGLFMDCTNVLTKNNGDDDDDDDDIGSYDSCHPPPTGIEKGIFEVFSWMEPNNDFNGCPFVTYFYVYQ